MSSNPVPVQARLTDAALAEETTRLGRRSGRRWVLDLGSCGSARLAHGIRAMHGGCLAIDQYVGFLITLQSQSPKRKNVECSEQMYKGEGKGTGGVVKRGLGPCKKTAAADGLATLPMTLKPPPNPIRPQTLRRVFECVGANVNCQLWLCLLHCTHATSCLPLLFGSLVKLQLVKRSCLDKICGS